MKEKGFLFSGNADFLEELNQKYLEKEALPDDWREFFNSISSQDLDYKPKWGKKVPLASYAKSYEYNVLKMIDSYRKFGHYLCNLDPLGMESPKKPVDFALELKDFAIDDANSVVEVSDYAFGLRQATVSQVESDLKKTYCSSIGVEFDHIDDLFERKWLYKEFEKAQTQQFSNKEKNTFLQTVSEVEAFEQYIHTKFPGAKRFSIEGGESCILALEELVKSAVEMGAEKILMATAHRGRLATLAKVIGKPYSQIFAGFAGIGKNILDPRYSGDVKYHMGYVKNRDIEDASVYLSLAYNPSHLESVNPVLAGQIRACQDFAANPQKTLGILVHGDASFCGQGVVAESIAMSNLEGYKALGIIHLVINNQIGFTANPQDTRSSRYPTEFAKISKLPIIHVNSEDVEAVVRAVFFAAKYRQKFLKDVVVDVFCYRKYGHNEGDEPLYTQGEKYNIIKNKPSCASLYGKKLLEENVLTKADIDQQKQSFKSFLDGQFAEVAKLKAEDVALKKGAYINVKSGVNAEKLKQLGCSTFAYPQDFAINPKLAKLFEQRRIDVETGKALDWGIVEALAFASILDEGKNIRLSGEDVGRGTFSHRHSVLHSQVSDAARYIPLNNLNSDKQGKYSAFDSLLSEFAVLGFEYGYSLEDSNSLVIWEAQFGDFANGAQTIIDQFISSGESKWCQQSNLVLLLPHGYEGQGPEHSSARVERFLALAACDNMVIAMPSTPASYFHLLRRHALQDTKKPLIIFTPKSLLRHRLAVSSLDQIDSDTEFSPVIEIKTAEKIKRVIFCSGKIYYDLVENCDKQIAIVRIEQFYPFPEDNLVKVLSQYSEIKDFIWCQEEPRNMGAYSFIAPRLSAILTNLNNGACLQYVGRDDEASPATGYLDQHIKQQTKIIQQALSI